MSNRQDVSRIGTQGSQSRRNRRPLLPLQGIDEVRDLTFECSPGFVLQSLDGHVAPMTAANEQLEKPVSRRITTGRCRRASRQPCPEPLQRRARVCCRFLKLPAQRERHSRGDRPTRQVRQEQHPSLTFANGAIAPGRRHVALPEGATRAMKKVRERVQARDCRLHSRRCVARFVSRKRDHGKHRLAHHDRWIATHEVGRLVFSELDVEHRIGQRAIDRQPVTVARIPRCAERRNPPRQGDDA